MRTFRLKWNINYEEFAQVRSCRLSEKASLLKQGYSCLGGTIAAIVFPIEFCRKQREKVFFKSLAASDNQDTILACTNLCDLSKMSFNDNSS